MRAEVRFAGVLAALLALGGCDKIKEHDALVSAMAERTNEIANLQAQVAERTKEIANLQAQMTIASNRIATLEALQLAKAVPPTAPGPSADQVEALKKVVAECVRTVRSSTPHDELSQFYSGFDAFYNPASGRVQNNIIYNGGLPAVYAFNKCMTDNGWPLS
jgi:uncharacterized coiled-coil protein SlyX